MMKRAPAFHIPPAEGSAAGREMMAAQEEEEEEDEMMCCGAAAEAGGGGGIGKKRRLGTEQVRALERSFEVENRLEPERKAQLAQELGLQPRQVAVWFQNRRARWKTKQLERDYTALKSRHDALRLDFDSLRRDHHSLLSQLNAIKSKLAGTGDAPRFTPQIMDVEEDHKPSDDSDSSGVLSADDNSCSPIISSASAAAAAPAAPAGGMDIADSEAAHVAHQLFKVEDQCFVTSGDDAASFFSDDHATTLAAWFCSDLASGAAGWQ